MVSRFAVDDHVIGQISSLSCFSSAAGFLKNFIQSVRFAFALVDFPAVFSIQRCGCKPQPLTAEQEQAVLNAHAEFGFGALSLENVLKARKTPVSHNKIHAVLLKHGLAVTDRKKTEKTQVGALGTAAFQFALACGLAALPRQGIAGSGG